MKIVVAYKWAPNPQDAAVGADGSVDWGPAKSAISEYDPVAIEAGRQLADATGAELIGITVGGKDAGTPAARKGALSRGLDSILVSADPSLDHIEATETATRLANMVNQVGEVSLVITGDISVDSGTRLVPVTLAGILGLPCLTEVSSLQVDGNTLTVERSWNGGTQKLSVSLPAVVSLAADAVVPRIPGMKDILAAGKKPSTEVAAEPVAVGTTEVVKTARPAVKERKHQIFTGESAAADLISALRNDQVL